MMVVVVGNLMGLLIWFLVLRKNEDDRLELWVVVWRGEVGFCEDCATWERKMDGWTG